MLLFIGGIILGAIVAESVHVVIYCHYIKKDQGAVVTRDRVIVFDRNTDEIKEVL